MTEPNIIVQSYPADRWSCSVPLTKKRMRLLSLKNLPMSCAQIRLVTRKVKRTGKGKKKPKKPKKIQWNLESWGLVYSLCMVSCRCDIIAFKAMGIR